MVGASAFGQISENEQVIQGALAQLRAKPEIMVELVGFEKLGTRTTSLYSNAFFKWDPLQKNGISKAEINDFVDSQHSKRIVADGTILWSYDFGRNTYSTYKYGAFNGPLPENSRADMLNELTTSAQGPSVFVSRLLRETFAGDNAQYRTWMPGAQISVVTTGSVKDPVNPDRVYYAGDFDNYVIYWYGTRLKRSAAFHLTRKAQDQPWQLAEIYYSDVEPLPGSRSRWVDWGISVHTDALPASTNYVFVPPATARAIANPRSTGGG